MLAKVGGRAGVRASEHYVFQRDVLITSYLWQEHINHNPYECLPVVNQNDSFAVSFLFLCVDIMVLSAMATRKGKVEKPFSIRLPSTYLWPAPGVRWSFPPSLPLPLPAAIHTNSTLPTPAPILLKHTKLVLTQDISPGFPLAWKGIFKVLLH